MKKAICEVCGELQHTKDCTLCVSKKNSKPNSSWALQTLPNWIKFKDKQMKVVTVEDIEKSLKLGPVLGPQSTTLRKDNLFPLCIQVSDIRLWLDLSCQNNSNWLSLIPSSPQDHNLIACQIDENIYYLAERNIKASEELKVWYSPHYKYKLPKQILEEVENAHILRQQNKGKESKSKKEECENLISSEKIVEMHKFTDAKLPNKLCNKTEFETSLPVSLSNSHLPNKLVSANNPLQFMYDSSLLDNIYISNTSTSAVGLDLPSLQTVSSNKTYFSSISLAPVTIFTSNSELYSIGTHQTSFLAATPFVNHAAASNFNIENNQLLPYIAQGEKKNILQNNFGETTNEIETKGKHFTLSRINNPHSYLTEERNSRGIINNHVFDENKLAHSEKKLLSSLQKICIKNKEVTFIHKYSSKEIKEINDTMPKKIDKVRGSKSVFSNNNLPKTIYINTQGRKYSKQNYPTIGLTISKENTENFIEVQETDFDDSSYDIISLNISDNHSDLNRTPVVSVTKIFKKECTTAVSVTKEYAKEKVDPLQGKSKLTPTENWICNQCEKEVSNLSHFMQHLKNHLLAYLGKRFKCEICHMLFRKFDNLKMHMITHRAKEPKEGAECWNQNQNTTNMLKSYYENEVKSKFSKLWKGPFSCQICLKTYNSAKCLLRHFSKHSGEFYCNLCKKEFSCSQNLKKHICIHRSENSLKCTLCKKAFSSARLLKFHSIEHNDRLKCSSCFRIFLCENYLKVHQMKCGKDSSKFPNCNSKEFSSTESSRFSCHICDRNFSSAVFLENHIAFCKQLDLVIKNGEVCCDICGDICAGPVELKIHHQIHTHPFLCLNCSHRFRSRATYDCHICGIDFTCDFCDTKVRSLQELFKHITCHGYPPFHCSRCLLPYYKIENLRLHECKLEINDNSGKLTKNKVCCPYCPSHFATAHNLKKHMASIHSVPLKQNFFCGKCGRGFHRSDLLKSHEKVHLEPSFKCSKCPKKFKSQKAFFDLHSVVHNGDFRFVCKLCNKTILVPCQHTDRKNDLIDSNHTTGIDTRMLLAKQHRIIAENTDHKEYQLRSLSSMRGFTQKKYLNRHEKSHFSTGTSKSTLLKCTYCLNVFSSLHLLRSHMKICSNKSEGRPENRLEDISA